MAISPDELQRAGALISTAVSLRQAAADWRAQNPEMRVVVVDAMDMRDETPALILGARQVFLATSSGHCWAITEQPELATALIFTEA